MPQWMMFCNFIAGDIEHEYNNDNDKEIKEKLKRVYSVNSIVVELNKRKVGLRL